MLNLVHTSLLIVGLWTIVSPFVVTQVICPNRCRNERSYRIVYSAEPGVRVESDKGVVRKDTIAEIDPLTDYHVRLRITYPTGEQQQLVVPLPRCEPLLPTTPLVAVEGDLSGPIPPLWHALSFELGIHIEWYRAGSDTLLATGVRFRPAVPGTYSAIARNLATHCASPSLANVRWQPATSFGAIPSVRRLRRP